MILFTRGVAQTYRALFARCVAGRPRGPAPPVVIQITAGVRTLSATTAEGVTLTHTMPAPKEPDDLLVLPAAVLAEVEGGTDETVALDRESKLLAQVRGALRRIDDGAFGVCLHCEEDISPKRLNAVPWTPYCISCQEQADRNQEMGVEDLEEMLVTAA